MDELPCPPSGILECPQSVDRNIGTADDNPTRVFRRLPAASGSVESLRLVAASDEAARLVRHKRDESGGEADQGTCAEGAQHGPPGPEE
jgi:hypothetical protein